MRMILIFYVSCLFIQKSFYQIIWVHCKVLKSEILILIFRLIQLLSTLILLSNKISDVNQWRSKKLSAIWFAMFLFQYGFFLNFILCKIKLWVPFFTFAECFTTLFW